jgi:phytoene dehydrogenase-like protein
MIAIECKLVHHHQMTTPPSLPEAADVVVIGAGHNGLVCAAYLAAAGLEVCVLEARDVVGGNTVTEELTLPGFAHDSCSSAHVLIQSNPLIADDELGLLSSYGLRYELTDPAVVLPQADGDLLVMHRDVEGTADELARYDAADAKAFTALVQEWTDGLAAVHGRWSSGLPLGDGEAAARYSALRSGTAYDLIHQRFRHPVVRSFMSWLAFATIQDPRRPGTGVLPASIASGRLRFGWATPVGGSGALPAALVRHLEAHGGSVVTSAPVASIAVTNGRAGEVRTTDGRAVKARRGVVSGAHLAKLAEMIDGAPAPDDVVRAGRAWRPGLSVFAVHAALRGDLGFGADRSTRSVAAGYGGSEGLTDQLDAFYRNETDDRDPWLLVVDQTVVDPDRAPDGRATFKILTVAPYERADGRDWALAKQEYAEAIVGLVAQRASGLGTGEILALRAESPVDVAAHNPFNLGGSCHGGEFVTSSGEARRGWPSYTTGLEGLFLTGSTSHPGGSVSGRPGRNTARAVLGELGLDAGQVMGPR